LEIFAKQIFLDVNLKLPASQFKRREWMKVKVLVEALLCVVTFSLYTTPCVVTAQPTAMPKETLIQYTSQFNGERFPDGRPKVPDSILERMKFVELEEAWAVLREAGYDYQYERGWYMTQPDGVLVGRAVTALYMPKRIDMEKTEIEQGKKDGRNGAPIHWTINLLQKGDVYVADTYRSVLGGPVIGGNLATSIFNKTGNGVVFNGEIRDLEQIEGMKGFNCFIRGSNPTYSWCTMLIGINVPVNIGEVTVMPGDVILGKREGIIVIPPHLAEKVCKTSELVRLRDQFGFLRLKEGKYTPGQIDSKWTDDIEKDFSQWLEKNIDKLTVPREQIQELLKQRTW
jgi:4-hydroxy-4-methyl-2-oxoglutarate aldolase